MPPVTLPDVWIERLKQSGFPMGRLSLGVAEEILRELPATITISDAAGPCAILYLRITYDGVLWCVGYEEAHGVTKNLCRTDESLSQAAAKMFYTLARSNLFTVGSIPLVDVEGLIPYEFRVIPKE